MQEAVKAIVEMSSIFFDPVLWIGAFVISLIVVGVMILINRRFLVCDDGRSSGEGERWARGLVQGCSSGIVAAD